MYLNYRHACPFDKWLVGPFLFSVMILIITLTYFANDTMGDLLDLLCKIINCVLLNFDRGSRLEAELKQLQNK